MHDPTDQSVTWDPYFSHCDFAVDNNLKALDR